MSRTSRKKILSSIQSSDVMKLSWHRRESELKKNNRMI
jgi:hypothetical protein